MSGQTPDSESRDVSALLAQQAQLHAWLDNLAAHAGAVPDRVASRVRADYEERLRLVVEALAQHQDAIRADVQRLREELHTADERHDAAVDQLEEARLRHVIGELDDAAWGSRRADLELEVEVADAGRRELREELERLEGLLEQFDAPEPAAVHPETAGGLGADAEAEELVAEMPAEPWEPQEEAQGVEAPANDLDFLVGLDRAIGAPGAEGEASAEEPELDTRPRVGIRCPECGYTNDSTAWYCGVCGVDLA